MSNKPYKTLKNNTSQTVGESVTTYQRRPTMAETLSSNEWNPNIPFHGTQDEWWEHFHQIENGNFSTWEEHQKKFAAWKTEYLANLMR